MEHQVAELAPVVAPAGDATRLGTEAVPLARLVGPPPTGLGPEEARAWTGRLQEALASVPLAPVAPGARGRRGPPQETWPAALRDPALDRRLRTEGWVTLRLIDRDQAAALRAAYGDIRGWDGEGFEPDPANGDRAYRTRVRAVLGEVLDPALDRVFTDHVPFLQGYYSKWPTTPESDLHADWTCVPEELGHRSHIAWTALQDTDVPLGAMAVLPHSHLVHEAPRGTDLHLPLPAAWSGHEDEIWSHMVTVPLQAGEALVFDMGLIHASHSNVTDQLRLAAVTCLRRRGSPLVYYRGTGDGRVLKYDIDDEFYLEMTPPQLVDSLPGRVPSSAMSDGDPGVAARRDAALRILARRERRSRRLGGRGGGGAV